MGSGDKHHLLSFHIHIPHIHFHHHHHHHHHHCGKRDMNNHHIPKGCVAILVGQKGEEQQRFIVPVMYMNHPLFMQLLKEAEEEYGFEHSGPINIPCHVEEFRYVQGLIDKELSHHHHNSWCFRA
ncbi:hypothetical protein Leryth_004671 [Lithospermum erythrorhizon]|uniref:SAUR family protein n=1 Tax=Lithospermum erythrorhizon TaxID=34254 RepID=A0AAV3Q362_LITER|nr:hypothetical protein Leryth_004671 [Lithospermum erythrorhizon]